MIAISSYRPLAPVAIWEHQLSAKATWEKVFSKIIYYGYSEQDLASPKTEFIPCDDKPTIKELARLASTQEGWTCLINSDIQVAPKMTLADRVLALNKIDCAFSFRIPVGRDKREDLGLDFFCARWNVWLRVFETIPAKFTIGRQVWDTWLCSFMMRHFRCADLSPSKLIFHPDHGERGDQTMEIQDRYLREMRWSAIPVTF